jgi:hypothetical protein
VIYGGHALRREVIREAEWAGERAKLGMTSAAAQPQADPAVNSTVETVSQDYNTLRQGSQPFVNAR